MPKIIPTNKDGENNWRTKSRNDNCPSDEMLLALDGDPRHLLDIMDEGDDSVPEPKGLH